MSTKFNKANFTTGEYLMYGGVCGMFIARFKYNRKIRTSFINFLVKNFTVEEYKAEYEKGNAPLEILRSKGYMTEPEKKYWPNQMTVPTSA